MKYSRPELEIIRFEDVDILTESDDVPIIVTNEEEPDPEGGF